MGSITPKGQRVFGLEPFTYDQLAELLDVDDIYALHMPHNRAIRYCWMYPNSPVLKSLDIDTHLTRTRDDILKVLKVAVEIQRHASSQGQTRPPFQA